MDARGTPALAHLPESVASRRRSGKRGEAGCSVSHANTTCGRGGAASLGQRSRCTQKESVSPSSSVSKPFQSPRGMSECGQECGFQGASKRSAFPQLPGCCGKRPHQTFPAGPPSLFAKPPLHLFFSMNSSSYSPTSESVQQTGTECLVQA